MEPFQFPQLSHNIPENLSAKNPDRDQEDEEHHHNQAGNGQEHSNVQRCWVPRGQRPPFFQGKNPNPKTRKRSNVSIVVKEREQTYFNILITPRRFIKEKSL